MSASDCRDNLDFFCSGREKFVYGMYTCQPRARCFLRERVGLREARRLVDANLSKVDSRFVRLNQAGAKFTRSVETS